MNEGFILIVGGAGYIGSHINKLLNQRGYKTIVFDNLSRGHREFVKWGEFFHGNLSDREQIKACFNKYYINAVMHLSAFAYVGESVSDPIKYYNNNVAATLNLLEVMLDVKLTRFIFSSSCATYGIPVQLPITEDHPQKPINPYGRTKLMVENILRDFESAYGMKHVSLRYFNASGADPETEIGEWHEPETHLIPLVLNSASGGPQVRIYGTDYATPDGTCLRDYIHVSDLADAHILALEYLLRTGKSGVFNLGNGNGFSVREVIKTAEAVTGKKIGRIESTRREGDPPVLVGDSEKAKKILKWTPKYYEIDKIIETAWKWHLKLLSR